MSGKVRIWNGTEEDWQAEHERQMRVRFMQVGEWRGKQEPVSFPAYVRRSNIVASQVAPQHTEPSLLERRLAALGLTRVASDTWSTKSGGIIKVAQYDPDVMFLAPIAIPAQKEPAYV